MRYPPKSAPFQNTTVAFDDISNKVNSVIAPVNFIKNVTTSKEISAAANKSIQEVSA